MPLYKTIAYVNEFTIIGVLAHRKVDSYIVTRTNDDSDTGWPFDTLFEAVQFCENRFPCLLTIAPDGDDGPKECYVYDKLDKAIEKIKENYDIPQSFYDNYEMPIGENGYIWIEGYDWGDLIGEKVDIKNSEKKEPET